MQGLLALEWRPVAQPEQSFPELYSRGNCIPKTDKAKAAHKPVS